MHPGTMFSSTQSVCLLVGVFNPFTFKVIMDIGNQSWIFIGRTDAETEAPILWPPDAKSWLIRKELRCWERLKAGEKGDDRGWDGYVASLIWWTWVWASFGRWWWTGKPSLLQSMGSQRVGHNWMIELMNMEKSFQSVSHNDISEHGRIDS